MAISDKMVYSSKRESAYQYSSQFQRDGIGKEFYKPLPIGIGDFAEIVSKGSYYVHKTLNLSSSQSVGVGRLLS
ncbi:MAG: hypothetical protein K2O91_07290 [Lachnospiraceae bacterium]|nr:hypothetical protein [Lachnospiraceae bacterium]